jgi:hypothetical protein
MNEFKKFYMRKLSAQMIKSLHVQSPPSDKVAKPSEDTPIEIQGEFLQQ